MDGIGLDIALGARAGPYDIISLEDYIEYILYLIFGI